MKTAAAPARRGGRRRAADPGSGPRAPGNGLPPATSRATAVPGTLRDLVSLTKPRVISLLLVTTVVPMLIATGRLPSLQLVLWTLLGGYLMAGGANAINMWVDRDIDLRMARTRTRPIPSGRMRPATALVYGLTLAATAFAILFVGANPLAAILALGGLLFYVFVYTLTLKRSSPQNIVIGGAAGAFPPLVGWAAAMGALDVTALLLFAIVFYWTPPHFWALALVKRRDYESAGVPMLPVVCGERETKVHVLLYSLILVPVTLLPVATGSMGWLYAAAALGLGAQLLRLVLGLLRSEETHAPAWRLYRFSLLYLALLFAAMTADRLLTTAAA
ncbi:MAG: protoheme IX farnesyltransferase [Gemmatimonadetes bacterium]|nr:protoheme IX farnesyltransferase [Gemmatimonadota bacterium]